MTGGPYPVSVNLKACLLMALPTQKDQRKPPAAHWASADLLAQQDTGAAIRAALADPRRPQGTRRDALGAFLVAGATRERTAPKTSQRLLKRLLSHFAYDESPAVRTRICCVEAAGPIAQGPQGPIAASCGKRRPPVGRGSRRR
jgi:hypothetical protein